MALSEEQRNPWRAIVAGSDYNLSSQDWEDLLTELDSLYTEAPIAPPASDYDLSAVIHLTHNKTASIIERGYKITGFVLTDDSDRKCISDMSAVRWFNDHAKFFRMMHPDSDQTASEQKPDLRAICIADENAFMKVLADRIVGNSNPEEDSRLDVAYAIARHLKLDWPSAYEAPPASEQKPVALPFAIFDQEIADLRRFHECAMDDEGYDVPKNRMKRLAEIGLVRRVSANYYEHTDFGLSVLNGDFDSQPQPDYKAQRDSLLEALEAVLHSKDKRAMDLASAAIASVKGGE